ncbi:hypothetical protein HYW54_00385 [Candidatus Gottesmanbacteria bacterium]|nr:hypothetical protein [Candidatus Gottesmanbacteria bacterium]
MKRILSIILLLLLTLPTYKILFSAGYFPMHDDTQPSRIFVMAKALSLGQFPVRLVPGLGYSYGYPLFNFYAPLPYYIGSFFFFLSKDIIIATKAMFLLGFILATISMFFLGRQVGGTLGGIFSSLLYTYAPYHAVNLYVRGAVGELYAYGILPFVLLALIKIIKGRLKEGFIIGSISIGALLLSHNILGLIMFYTLALFSVVYLVNIFLSKKKYTPFLVIVSMIITGIGLSAFFTVPALLEAKYTKIETLTEGTSNFKSHFVYLDQLWDSPWGYAGSSLGRSDGMSFKIGKILLLAAASIFTISVWRRSQLYLILASLTLFFISLFLMLDISTKVWETVPYFPFIQYPWRFLNLSLLFLCLIAAGITKIIPSHKLSILICFVVITLTIVTQSKNFTPRYLYPPDPTKFISAESLKFDISKISDEYLPNDLQVPRTKEELPKETVEIIKDEPTEKIYNIKANDPRNLDMNMAFFPGWKGEFNNRPILIKNRNGKINIDLPQIKKGILKLQFLDTPIRTIANSISFLSLILVVYVSLFGVRIIWPKSPRSK